MLSMRYLDRAVRKVWITLSTGYIPIRVDIVVCFVNAYPLDSDFSGG